MRIDQYHFGHIDIEGDGYDADVIIFPDHVQERWWRKEGHRLAREDLDTVLAEKPELLVVGTGYTVACRFPKRRSMPCAAQASMCELRKRARQSRSSTGYSGSARVSSLPCTPGGELSG